jgi:GT2 family glycosyltransferase
MNRVGFVILSYNSMSEAARLAETLRGTLVGSGDVIVLVDNASSSREGETRWRALASANVRLLELSRNCGYSAGNNAGIDALVAEGIDNVIILNPDVTIDDPGRFVREVRSHFERDQFVCMGFGVDAVPPYATPVTAWTIAFPAVARTADRMRRRSDVSDAAFRTGRIHGCAFGLRARQFRALGLFDDRVFLYGEEAIISIVARRAGHPVMQSNRVTVTHGHPDAVSGINWSAFRWLQASTAFTLREYYRVPGIVAGIAGGMSVAQLIALRVVADGVKRLRSIRARLRFSSGIGS